MENNTKMSLPKKSLIILFSLVFIIHIGVIFGLQIFNPFASITNDSADYQEYQEQAQIISQRLSEGNFSIKDLGTDHYYPVIVGYLYFFLGGSPILIGQIFNAIISGLSAILLFMIMRKLGGSMNNSLALSFIGSIYPTYLLLSSLFHEDAIAILFVLIALFFGLKALQSFTLKNILIWYAMVIIAAEFRSFLGLLLGIAFLLSYILFHSASKEEKIKNSVKIGLMIFFISFIAEVIARVSGFMAHGHSVEWIFQIGYPGNFNYAYQPNLWNFEGWFFGGWYSGILPILYSFIWTIIGPFPWNFSSTKEFLYLIESLPWLLILPLIFTGIGKAKKTSPCLLFPAIFALILILPIALYVETREPEVMMRLRIPAFLSLLVFSVLALPEKITVFSFLNSIKNEWQKILKYII